MTHPSLLHRRTHNILLLQNLLAGRGGEASPFTLVLDSVEQSAKTIIAHYIHNATKAKKNVIFVSFETPSPGPTGITTFISARRKDPSALQREVGSHLSATKQTFIILDTLHPFLQAQTPLPTFLAPLLVRPTSLLATCHLDIPLTPSSYHHSTSTQVGTHHTQNPYAPPPLALLRYLATTILTPSSLPQTLSHHHALHRSLPAPVFGLAENRDGVIIGRGANTLHASSYPTGNARGEGEREGSRSTRGCILHLEHRRKSGRSVEETFFLPLTGEKGAIMLLADHPLFRPSLHQAMSDASTNYEDATGGIGGGTFDLGLTEKQRRDREGVVLPYFDAQRRGEDGDGGEGGRILYDMGVEDDFDEEEDEI